MMEWFYVQEGEQRGPVDEAELIRLRSSGELKDSTLVWKEGMADWVPFQSLQVGLGSSSGSSGAAGGPAAGGRSAQGDAPVVVAAGSGVEATSVSGPNPEDLIPEDYRVEIGLNFGRAWELMKGNFWPIVGVWTLVFVAYLGASSVPLLGYLVPFFLAVPLLAGLSFYGLLLVRGKEAALGDAFCGFSRNFVNLLLLNLAMQVLVIAAMIPGFAISGFAFMSFGEVGAEVAPFPMAMAVIGIVVALVPATYIQVAWMFAPILCIDRMLGFWDALKVSMQTAHKHFFSLLLFMIVIGLLAAAGMIALCVGMFVTMPLAMLATIYLYEDIFGKGGERSDAI